MKTISANLQTHIEGDTTNLVTCWKLTLNDAASTVMGFTDHVEDLEIDSVTYESAAGYTGSNIENKADLSVDNLDVVGLLDSSGITEADLLAGRYDYAGIHIFVVNYNDLTQGVIKQRRGWIGEVQIKNGIFIAELRGMAQALTQNIGSVYSPLCRAEFGDTQCGINLTSHDATGTITSVTDRITFTDSTRGEAANYWNGGRIEWTGGNNNNLSMEVKAFASGGQITLFHPMPYDVETTDPYRIIRGCDKTAATCKSTYSNIVNFRGEPFIPGVDEIMKFGGQ